MEMEQDFHKKGGISFKMYYQYFAKNNNIAILIAFTAMTLAFNALLCGLLIWMGIW